MRRIFAGLAIIVGLVFLTNSLFAQNKYVGVKKCSMCHKGEKKGKMLEIWQASGHAKAFETLGTPAAKEVAKKAGLDGDPQKSDECLVCHVTGHGEAKGVFLKAFKVEEGVQCEACHGAGSAYQKMSIMKDEAKFKANGGVVPDEKLCKTCHNEKSPTYKAFDYASFYKKIEHKVPAK